MNGIRSDKGWGARLLIALALILVGAGAAIYGLAHYQRAARVLGVIPPAAEPTNPHPVAATPIAQPAPQPPSNASMNALEQRVAAVEQATRRAEGSAGRADALVVAFAARRAIDRGIALGYLENLLSDRFGAQHPAAVATIITDSRQPVRLNDLSSEYEAIGQDLRRGGPEDNWWTDFKREIGSLVEVHRADRPAINVDARYNRALQHLSSGEVDQALAETMRLPGATHASNWADKARRYVAVHRALDEVESAALMSGPTSSN